MGNTNQFLGLARGPIDHNASSVINVIANSAIQMGSAIILIAPQTSELLPRVREASSPGPTNILYGIVVGGDADGVFNNGSPSVLDINRAATVAGQGVVVVTQGRSLARVVGEVLLGESLTGSGVTGVLKKAESGNLVIARALQPVDSGDTDMVAVDVQREGPFS